MDFVDPGIWAAFLCVHQCPFLHTCGVYRHDYQNTQLAITSNNELRQNEDKIAPLFVQQVHRREHLLVSLVMERAPHMMHRLHRAQDNLQVPWQAFAEMSPSVIRKSDNPPNYRRAIHSTFLQKPCRDSPCLPTLEKNMLATIDDPSMLLKFPIQCISAPGASVLLACPQSTRDQWGVHAPSVLQGVVFSWQVSIPTSFSSSKAMQAVSSCWVCRSSVLRACIELFTADYNSSAPCFSITAWFSGCSGAPKNSHMVW